MEVSAVNETEKQNKDENAELLLEFCVAKEVLVERTGKVLCYDFIYGKENSHTE